MKKPMRYVTMTATQTRDYGKFQQTFTISEHIAVTSRGEMHGTLDGMNAFIIEQFAQFEQAQIVTIPANLKRENVERATPMEKVEPVTRIVKLVKHGKTKYYAQTPMLHAVGALLPDEMVKEHAIDQHLIGQTILNVRDWYIHYTKSRTGFNVVRIRIDNHAD